LLARNKDFHALADMQWGLSWTPSIRRVT
jgi:hypothetical protein